MFTTSRFEKIIRCAVCVSLAALMNVQAASAASSQRPLVETITVAERQQAVEALIDRLTGRSSNTERRDGKPPAKAANSYRVASNFLASEKTNGTDALVRQEINIDLARTVRFDMFFATGAADISDNGRFILSMVADALKSPGLERQSFLIGGHTDAGGAMEKNQALSLARARAVYDELVKRHDIAPQRLIAAGFGETRLLKTDAPHSTENRKIELAVRLEPSPPRVADAERRLAPLGQSFAKETPGAVRTLTRRDLRMEDIWHVEPMLAPAGRF